MGEKYNNVPKPRMDPKHYAIDEQCWRESSGPIVHKINQGCIYMSSYNDKIKYTLGKIIWRKIITVKESYTHCHTYNQKEYLYILGRKHNAIPLVNW